MKDLNIKSNYKNPESIISYYKKNLNNDLNRYLKRSSIVDLITKYELYYHISLGNYAFETILDLKETAKKLQELNLYVKPEIALFNIYKIIDEKKDEEDLEKNLEKYIRKRAALQALSDFIIADKELIGTKYYEEVKKEDILNDKFFTDVMKSNFEINYQKTYEHYNMIINDKFIKEIKTLL